MYYNNEYKEHLCLFVYLLFNSHKNYVKYTLEKRQTIICKSKSTEIFCNNSNDLSYGTTSLTEYS